ncbi:diguanylate cyclase [Alteromonas macleodii str. 'Balearic Sea AD45']|uniref:sensor domain-containing diguanylate cyclase n=1 Tax=Alteromonas macleodii TaxID=28108 RepID=UPI000286FC77|nr:diguanylate cyclase [Alteromonas macleodii]AFT96641.1 diguanylate cyclase [Alteromonas macleodii str. 'Balearic Sea AD45']PTU03135.1 GGDEF domain-containing protein [Pseudomonas sp. HMWF031]
MKALLLFIGFVIVNCLWGGLSHAYAKSTASLDKMQLVNDKLWMYYEEGSQLTAEDILAKYQQNTLIKNTNGRVSYGFTGNTVWGVLAIELDAYGVLVTRIAKNSPINVPFLPLKIEIDNAWLDNIDLYFFENGQRKRHVKLGDNQVHSARFEDARMPSVFYRFTQPETLVVFQFSSEDPMTIPIYVGPPVVAKNKTTENAYFYGALYGALVILLVYNLVLYSYIKERRYLLYSLYLLSFLLFNFTYTGHGFWWLWSESIFLQQWLLPALMFLYLFSAVRFTIEFLNTQLYLPKLYRCRKYIYGALGALAVIIVLIGSRSFAVMSQLAVLTTIAIWMLLIGIFAYRNGDTLAKFFLPAILCGTGGAMVSSLATWGLIPYSKWAFRGIEIGMVLEMSLLSISLAFNYKQVQQARRNAERDARLDPLTSLYNRRAFEDLVYPIWEMGKRSNKFMSVMLIDIDWFKGINDKYGHDMGDKVLKKVAEEIKGQVRGSDITFRWGGEEFLVFLPNTRVHYAKQIAENLRVHLFTHDINKFVRVTVSIGVAGTSPGEEDINVLIKQSDQALYLAKAKGRNKVVLWEEDSE